MLKFLTPIFWIHNNITIVRLQVIQLPFKMYRIHKIFILNFMALIQFLMDLDVKKLKDLVFGFGQLFDIGVNIFDDWGDVG